MSFDEYCLRQLPQNDTFFYLWRNRPSVIIGLNQNAYGEVNLPYLSSHNISLARRVTGGGAVYHDLQNLNYTFVGPSVSPYPFSEALRRLGVAVEITGRNDIFVGGRKVSGYARRVWHDREIVHGTMMYDVDLDTLGNVLAVPGSKLSSKGIASVGSRVANLKDYLPQFSSLDELQAAIQEILSGSDCEYCFQPSQIAEIRRIADEKFSSWEWIYGHSHEADFVRKARLSCGIVEVNVSLNRGIIANLSFTGDFIGDLPANDLECALKGVRFERDKLSEILSQWPIEKYFEGCSINELVDLVTKG